MPEGEGASTTGSDAAGGDSGKGAPASGGGTASGGNVPSGNQPASGSQTFTQDQVDRIISERLARQRAQFGDVDDLRKKAEEFDKLQDAQKTELEKAVDKARKEAENAARAETNKTWESRVIRSEVRLAAAGKLADPEDAVRFLDLSAFKVDDNGSVDDKAIAAAIDELVKTKPYLTATANGTRPPATRDFDAGSRTPAPGGRSMNDLIRQAAGRT